MLTPPQLKAVQELINIIIDCERNLEAIRVELCEQPLFSMKPIFERFDQARRGQIDSADVLAFCEDNSIDITGAEAYYLTKRLDRNQDGRVTFEDLTSVLLPKDNSRSRVVTALREPYFITRNMMLPQVIEQGVADFIRELLFHIRRQQHIKHKLLSQDDFNIFNLQRMIDTRNKGFVDIENLTTFVRSNNLQCDDLQYFFWYGDQNEDGQISYAEFIEVLMNAERSATEPKETKKPATKSATRLHQYEVNNNNNTKSRVSFESRSHERNDVSNRSRIQAESSGVKPIQERGQYNYVRVARTGKTEHIYDQDPGSFRSKEVVDVNPPLSSVSFGTKPSPVKVYAFNLHQQLSEYDEEKRIAPVSSQRTQALRTQSQYSTPIRNQGNEEHMTPDHALKKQLNVNRSYNTPERPIMNRDLPSTTPEKHIDGESNEYQKYISHIRSNKPPIKPHILMQDQVEAPQKPNSSNHNSQNPTYPLFRLLLKQVLVMREVEELKRQLSLRNDFNLLDAFRLFDQQGFGRASIEDLQSGFKDLGLQPTSQQITLLLKQHSKRHEGFLRYSDFTRMILPSTPDYQVLLQNRAPTFNQSNFLTNLFSPTTIQYFKDLLQAILVAEEVIAKYKSYVNEKPHTLFRLMDQDGKGVLDETDFRNLFAMYDVHPTALELRRVISRFNSSDDTINLDAFVAQIA